jgi:hypothetical protein
MDPQDPRVAPALSRLPEHLRSAALNQAMAQAESVDTFVFELLADPDWQARFTEIYYDPHEPQPDATKQVHVLLSRLVVLSTDPTPTATLARAGVNPDVYDGKTGPWTDDDVWNLWRVVIAEGKRAGHPSPWSTIARGRPDA